jgi:DNA-binding NtrC family response regulator
MRHHDQEPGTSAARPRADHSVLVVDDDDGVRSLLAAGLPREGFDVLLAATGRQAANLYRSCGSAIDVVLMDVRMPGADGPGTLAVLRQQDAQVLCCFMSGDLGGHTEDELRRLGTGELLRKPFTLADAGRILRAEIDRGKAEESDRDGRWQDDGGQGRPVSP